MEIFIRKLNFYYDFKTINQKQVLFNINLYIKKGDFIVIVGKNASGKTTLIKNLSGLLIPNYGKIRIGNYIINSYINNNNINIIRKKIGIIFQTPELQLFEETVKKDVSFALLQNGISKKIAYLLAEEMLKNVKIEKKFFNKSPFVLSVGQMKKVIIAGILLIKPEIFILDEPMVNLDFQNQNNIKKIFIKLNKINKKTIIWITHNLNEVIEFADKVVFLEEGYLLEVNKVKKNFYNNNINKIKKMNLKVFNFFYKLKKKGLIYDKIPITMKDLIKILVKFKKREKNDKKFFFK